MLGKQNITIDIETLGLTADSVILQIGAVEFDESGVLHEFESGVDVVSQISAGRTVDPGTVRWWVENHPKTFFGICGSVVASLPLVLKNLCYWVGDVNWSDVVVWANGTDFDIAILNHAFGTYGMKAPWKYSNVRDYRTIRKCFGQSLDADRENEVAHTALADAKAQAEHLITLAARFNRVFK